jgi:muconolactone delta-isomerase
MQFLALSKRSSGVTGEQLDAHAVAEARVEHELVSEGHVRSIHMCPERPGSMVILEAGSLEEAQQLLARLPMVRDGLIGFGVSRMLPYTGYAALFKDEFVGPPK